MNDPIYEIADRCRRMETTLHKLKEHLGMGGESTTQCVAIEVNVVSVQGYDITLSRIKNELLTAGKFDPKEVVYVDVDGKCIAEITFL